MTAKHPPVLFLDIDGVMNGGEYDPEVQSSTFRADCVKRLNRVLDSTNCVVVLSSAWRYMVLEGAMTLSGFSYLMRTHGVKIADRLIGTTGRDTQVEDRTERGRQVKAWLAEHPEVTCYAVVDDLDVGFDGLNFVQTDGNGLTDVHVDALVGLLRARTKHCIVCSRWARTCLTPEHDCVERKP